MNVTKSYFIHGLSIQINLFIIHFNLVYSIRENIGYVGVRLMYRFSHHTVTSNKKNERGARSTPRIDNTQQTNTSTEVQKLRAD